MSFETAAQPTTKPLMPVAPAPPIASPNYAFLVHSQNTLSNTLPPDVDNEQVARQKRRRTSPEDQVILESEFEKNDKPDKAARRVLASKVKGMGEKEVQIWFQNKRQSIRRRSRPLYPDDQPLSQPLTDSPESGSSTQNQSSQQFVPASDTLVNNDMSPANACLDGQRRSISSLRPASSEALRTTTTTSEQAPIQTYVGEGQRTSRRSFKRSLSGKRLSMTAEGDARVLGDDESSPSPPKPHPLLEFDVKDIQSPKFYHGGKPLQAGSLIPKARRTSSGRSRDSRAWEFWCDNEAGNELSQRASQEHSGSAAAAIDLIRTSSRKALALTNSSRANRVKVSLDDNTKPSLPRSKTSMARLETHRPSPLLIYEDSCDQHDEGSLLSSRYQDSPSGESNKENAEKIKSPRLVEFEKVQPKTNSRRGILKASRTAPLSRASMKGEPYRNGVEDDEVLQFMKGGPRNFSDITDEQDIDVVEGLLSLSRGT